MTALASETRTPPTTGQKRQLVTFRLGDRLAGIPIEAVCEILRVEEVTPVPDAPAVVRGVVNLRGAVVTVLDLRTVLSMGAVEVGPASRMVVVNSGDEIIGLLVDRVADVVSVDPEDREPLPANMETGDVRFFTGVYRVQADLLVALDVVTALAEGVIEDD
jgi:purine-binding chemotaxis protein CheW